MSTVTDICPEGTEPKQFRLNVKQIAYLLSKGEVVRGRFTIALDTIAADLLTTGSRASSDELAAQFAALLAPKASELTDGFGTLCFSGAEVIRAGFPVSALKNVNYWRAYQSAAARIVHAAGWLPSLSTKLDESNGTMSVEVQFVNGPAAVKGLAKIAGQHAEAAATMAAAKAAKDAGDDASDDDGAIGEE